VIASKDSWLALDAKQKAQNVSEALEQLELIEHDQHPISHRADQGRLASVKKDLEKFIISALGWESDAQTRRY